MNRSCRCLLLLLAALAWGPLIVQGSDISLTSEDGVLVLRNGYVLAGRITPLGDHYLVTSGDNDQVRMPRARVAMVCRDLEEAYLRQRDLCRAGDVRAHLELASWCLRHGLTARAADQVLAVLALDPAHPELTALESRLRTRQLADEEANRDNTVAAANHTEMEVTAAEIPPAAVQHFTNAVQPLLMNRCATNACHGPGAASDFRLLRPAFNQVLTRRMTQRNLYAVLEHVKREQPSASPLLVAPTSPHGGLAQPVLGPLDSEQIRLLTAWVESLQSSSQARPETVLEARALHQRRGPAAARPAPQPDLSSAPATDVPLPASDAASEASAEEPLSRDPFDPAIFNRRR